MTPRLVAAALMVAATVAGAQQVAPEHGGLTASIGQPNAWKFTAGLAMGWGGRRDGVDNGNTGAGQLGVHHDLGNPVLGAAALNFEAYAGAMDTRTNGGLRARIASPALRLGIGADYNVIEGAVRPLVSVYTPGIRGGFFGNGTELRLDVLPSRYPQFSIGIETPVHRQIPSGATRPRIDHVRLSKASGRPPPAPPHDVVSQLAAPLREAREAAAMIRMLTAPYLDEAYSNRKRDEANALARIRALKPLLPPRSDSTSAIEVHVRRYHDAVGRAFSIAMVATSGAGATTADATAVTARAREILLEYVLLPYDRLLGQVKRHDSTGEFAGRARAEFARRVLADTGLSRPAGDAVEWVFSQVLDIVEENRAVLRWEWGDSRFVWLPLQYALLPQEHDTQAELDALVERAVGTRFTDGNVISYVINDQFQHQLSRSIHAARDYHVLWIHDFRGVDARGDPDAMSYAHVLHSYLAALTQRVLEYDRTGRIPVFIILLDEWFYEANDSRFWLELLEDPVHHQLDLPRARPEWERTIRAAQDSLRQAIAESRLLQAHRTQFGDAWLRNLVKVHVNITNMSDPSFWSWRVASLIPLFDNLMRDHRKIAFYDITEEDPYRGEALFTGAGVGEHYANLAWEDRALLVRGPALLELKTAARTALRQQGMRPDRIPWPLQPRPFAPDYASRVAEFARGQQSSRALTTTNETGFGDKRINVAKAVLYTLMPAGSVIKLPDSIWNSAFWGSAATGAALRGVRVLIVGPSLQNAPAQAFGSMIRMHELFWRLLTVRRELASEIDRTGGLLRVGLFSTQVPVTDVAGKMRAVNDAFTQQAWLRTLFGFPPQVYAGLAALATATDLDGTSVRQQGDFESDNRPKLHMKANFFASREAWTLMSRPEWADLAREFLEQRLSQVRVPPESIGRAMTVPPPLLDLGAATVSSWLATLPPEQRARVVFYTIMGSQNQNARSMVEDGEVAIVVSSWPSIIPYLDLLTLIGQSRWLDDPAQLAALLPPQSRVKRRAAHWMALAF